MKKNLLFLISIIALQPACKKSKTESEILKGSLTYEERAKFAKNGIEIDERMLRTPDGSPQKLHSDKPFGRVTNCNEPTLKFKSEFQPELAGFYKRPEDALRHMYERLKSHSPKKITYCTPSSEFKSERYRYGSKIYNVDNMELDPESFRIDGQSAFINVSSMTGLEGLRMKVAFQLTHSPRVVTILQQTDQQFTYTYYVPSEIKLVTLSNTGITVLDSIRYNSDPKDELNVQKNLEGYAQGNEYFRESIDSTAQKCELNTKLQIVFQYMDDSKLAKSGTKGLSDFYTLELYSLSGERVSSSRFKEKPDVYSKIKSHGDLEYISYYHLKEGAYKLKLQSTTRIQEEFLISIFAENCELTFETIEINSRDSKNQYKISPRKF